MQNAADRYAVMGNPIAHSRSPQIHEWFAEQTAQSMTYQAICVELARFAPTADTFFKAGGRGLNVTVPFKEDAFHFANRLTQRAQAAGAVNTLRSCADDGIEGDNTDGAGLITDLKVRQGLQLAGQRILLLGAGGAARGVIGPLLAQQPDRLVLVNRTDSKARELLSVFGHPESMEVCQYDRIDSGFDLIINATSASLHAQLPPLPATAFAAGCLAYDMVYGATPTAFMQFAATCGAQVRDGLGMLVEQAAEAFFVWRGVRPDTEPVYERLRAALSKEA